MLKEETNIGWKGYEGGSEKSGFQFYGYEVMMSDDADCQQDLLYNQITSKLQTGYFEK